MTDNTGIWKEFFDSFNEQFVEVIKMKLALEQAKHKFLDSITADDNIDTESVEFEFKARVEKDSEEEIELSIEG